MLAGGGLLLMAPPAGGHALLSSSEPGDGARLTEAPPAVLLVFTEAPEPGLLEASVLDPAGTVVSTGPASVDPGAPHRVRVPLGGLPDGVFTVTWRVVSVVDGHTTAGAFAFGINESPAGVELPEGAEVTAPPLSPVETAGRWAFLVGAGLLVGVGWVGAAAFAAPPRGSLRLATAAWVLAAVGVVALADGQRRTAGASYAELAGTGVGRALLLRLAAVAVAGLALILARGGRRRWPAAAGVAAAAAAGVHAAAGHAGTPVQIAGQWVHIVAGGVWLGGLAALLVGVRGEPDEKKSVAVRRFSAVALVALVVVAGTGVVRALDEVGTWSDLPGTGYGRLVLVKVASLVALVALGAVNRYRNVRAAGRSLIGLRRTSRAELAIAVVVVGAAALMAGVPPPQSPEAAERGVTASGTDFAGTVRVELRVEPGTAGANRFELRVGSPADGDPVPAERVSLRFAFLGPVDVAPTTLELEPVGEGAWRGSGGNLSVPGLWEIDAVVQSAADAVEVTLRLGTDCGARILPGDPTLHEVTTALGSAQGYLDPGEPGPSEVHMTYFDETGGELEVEEVTMTATDPDGDTIRLEARRLGPGHFVASVNLRPGGWRVDTYASTRADETAAACFEETIG